MFRFIYHIYILTFENRIVMLCVYISIYINIHIHIYIHIYMLTFENLTKHESRGGGLGSRTIFKKFNEPYAP